MTNARKEPARCFLRGLRPRSSTNSWSTSLYSYVGSYNNLQAGEQVPLTSGKLALLDWDTGGACAVRNYDGPHGFPRPLILSPNSPPRTERPSETTFIGTNSRPSSTGVSPRSCVAPSAYYSRAPSKAPHGLDLILDLRKICRPQLRLSCSESI